MTSPSFSLGFRAFLLTQALGALNDNLFRNGLIMLIAFYCGAQLGDAAPMYIAACSALFVFPFFLLSATAGRLADRFDHALLIRWLKRSEVLIMLCAAYAFYTLNLNLLLVLLCCMGVQSALFGPVKYSIIPQLVTQERLLHANAWVEALTFITILAGTLISSSVMLNADMRMWLAYGCIAIAALGMLSAQGIPKQPAKPNDIRIRWNILADLWVTLRFGFRKAGMSRKLLGIGWFWAAGTIIISQLPAFAAKQLTGESHVTLLLGLFTFGIGIGAFTASRLLKGKIAFHLTRYSCWLVTIGALILTGLGIEPRLISVASVGIAIGCISFGAGMFVVPLYTYLQHHTDASHRGRMIAASNIFDAFTMTLASIISIGLIAMKLPIAMVMASFALMAPLMIWLLKNE
ncbi:MAG: MFS transporter [Rickettsiales bacterium]|nr:MFS transporter [Rickettsiales bacterium]